MSLQSRAQKISQIGSHLNAPVLAYVTGDRAGLQTQISAEQILLFPRHLTSVGSHDRIALLLYTRGGDTNVPWSVITAIREHCSELTVLIPFAAHSSGTLLALGADEIVMTRYATISPIDPTVANAFNPQDPTNPGARFPIAVEDVLAFLDLAKENVQGEAYERTFEALVQSVHPLALGNVKRSISQIRQLAKKLIGLHPPAHTDEELAAMVTRLTTEFYSHQHLIGRAEARDLGLPAVDADPVLEQHLLDYYGELKTDLELLTPFNPANILRTTGTAIPVASPAPAPASPPTPTTPTAAGPVSPMGGVPPGVPLTVERGYVETATTCDAFVTRGVVAWQAIMTTAGPQQAVAFDIHTEQWETLA